MFAIGAALGEARARLGLSLADVERETRLREHYLRALEEEQFDALPDGYRRSFLRTYAGFLGLDADLLVDEYAARFETPPHPGVVPLSRPVRRRRPLVVAALLALAAVAAIGVAVAAVLLPDGNGPGTPAVAASTASVHPTHAVSTRAASTRRAVTTASPPGRARTRTRTRTSPARPPVIALTLTATAGPCWVSVHRASADGPTAYEGTLQEGQTVSLHGVRFWARIGAPSNLSVTVDGTRRTLPARVGNVVVDTRGVASAP